MSISRTNDVLKVSNATRKAVNARDHQNVTGSQEVQHSAQLIAPAVVVPLRFSERIKSQRVSILRDWTALAWNHHEGFRALRHDVTAWLGLMLRRLFRL